MTNRYSQLAIKLEDLDFLGPLNRRLRTKDADGTEHREDWYVLPPDATPSQQAAHILGLLDVLGDVAQYNVDNFFSMLTQSLPAFRASVFRERRDLLPMPAYGDPEAAVRAYLEGDFAPAERADHFAALRVLKRPRAMGVDIFHAKMERLNRYGLFLPGTTAALPEADMKVAFFNAQPESWTLDYANGGSDLNTATLADVVRYMRGREQRAQQAIAANIERGRHSSAARRAERQVCRPLPYRGPPPFGRAGFAGRSPFRAPIRGGRGRAGRGYEGRGRGGRGGRLDLNDPSYFKILANGRRVRRFDAPCPTHPDGDHDFGGCPNWVRPAGAHHIDEADVHVGAHEVVEAGDPPAEVTVPWVIPRHTAPRQHEPEARGRCRRLPSSAWRRITALEAGCRRRSGGGKAAAEAARAAKAAVPLAYGDEDDDEDVDSEDGLDKLFGKTGDEDQPLVGEYCPVDDGSAPCDAYHSDISHSLCSPQLPQATSRALVPMRQKPTRRSALRAAKARGRIAPPSGAARRIVRWAATIPTTSGKTQSYDAALPEDRWEKRLLAKAESAHSNIQQNISRYAKNKDYNTRLAEARIEQLELIRDHYKALIARRKAAAEAGSSEAAGPASSGDAEPVSDAAAASDGEVDEAKQPASN